MSERHTFHIITLGCRTNQYESQSLRESWISRGLKECADPAEADLILINSCAVTAKAVRDTGQAARRAARESPCARIIIAGCASQVVGEKLAKSNPGAQIVPQSQKAGLADFQFGRERKNRFPTFRVSGSERSRAVVKIQDGCSHGCSYCIVPKTRGRSVSREPAEAVAEVRRLFEAGYAEVVISGINLRHYGRDLGPEIDLWDLINMMESELAGQWSGRARIRLSSLDPAQLGSKALDVLGGTKLVCPHLHLSLQSLSPKILEAMNRGHYNFDKIMEFLSQLYDVWPVYGLGADFIAGFPGETEEDHLMTLDAIRAMPLTYAHVFPYSRRPGTVAASVPGQVDKAGAKSRALALRDLATGKRREFLKKLSTLKQVNVVIESESPARGICEYYARCTLPDKTPNHECGVIYPARPVSTGEDGLIAEPLSESA